MQEWNKNMNINLMKPNELSIITRLNYIVSINGYVCECMTEKDCDGKR